MGYLGTTIWTACGAAALVLAALWADRIVRKRRAEAAEDQAEDG